MVDSKTCRNGKNFTVDDVFNCLGLEKSKGIRKGEIMVIHSGRGTSRTFDIETGKLLGMKVDAVFCDESQYILDKEKTVRLQLASDIDESKGEE